VTLSALAVAACAADSRGTSGGGGGDGDDGSGGGGAPTTLATVSPGRIALAGDCIAVAAEQTVTCVPLAGGAPTTLATLGSGTAVRPLAAGSAFVVSSVPADFGPADAQFELDRVGLDGTVTKLLAASGGAGAGEGLAFDGTNAVFTTGGDADLDSIPVAGGSATLRAFDSGNFGEVALVGTTAYYYNAPEIFSHDMTATEPADPGEEPVAGGGDFEDPSLASDGTTLVAAGTSIEGSATTVITIPTGPTIAPLPAPGGPVAAIDGTAYVIAGGDLVAIDLASGAETTIAAGEEPFDVLATADQVIWITQAGAVRTLPR
jgi:hypothetical protein